MIHWRTQGNCPRLQRGEYGRSAEIWNGHSTQNLATVPKNIAETQEKEMIYARYNRSLLAVTHLSYI